MYCSPCGQDTISPFDCFFQNRLRIGISKLRNQLFSLLLLVVVFDLVPHGEFIFRDRIATDASFDKLFLCLYVSLFRVKLLFAH